MGVSGSSFGAVKNSANTRVTRAFFERDPLTCARDLLGCELVWRDTSGIIVETEAYAEYGDEASHTFFRPSVRNFVHERPPGSIYIYLNYGVHWLLNFLVKGESSRGFVLIRALEPRSGIDRMAERRGVEKVTELCSGPGKLTQAIGITAEWNGADF
jgi:DNA-3-methyladenine glycosylase